MQIEVETIVHIAPRTGRELQRYHLGRRQVVGCIPYRYVENKRCSSVFDELQVLLVSSQKCETMMFPKGGWESDESMEKAALRECVEEAGVTGTIQRKLGTWCYKSKSQDILHDGYMFPLLVEEQLDDWPEKNVRQRKWVNARVAKELCPYVWMKEALDSLVERLVQERVFERGVLSLPCYFQDPSSPCFLETLSLPCYLEDQLAIVEGNISCHTIISTQLNIMEDEVSCHTRISASGREQVSSRKSTSVQLNGLEDEVFCHMSISGCGRERVACYESTSAELNIVEDEVYCHRASACGRDQGSQFLEFECST